MESSMYKSQSDPAYPVVEGSNQANCDSLSDFEDVQVDDSVSSKANELSQKFPINQKISIKPSTISKSSMSNDSMDCDAKNDEIKEEPLDDTNHPLLNFEQQNQYHSNNESTNETNHPKQQNQHHSYNETIPNSDILESKTDVSNCDGTEESSPSIDLNSTTKQDDAKKEDSSSNSQKECCDDESPAQNNPDTMNVSNADLTREGKYINEHYIPTLDESNNPMDLSYQSNDIIPNSECPMESLDVPMNLSLTHDSGLKTKLSDLENTSLGKSDRCSSPKCDEELKDGFRTSVEPMDCLQSSCSVEKIENPISSPTIDFSKENLVKGVGSSILNIGNSSHKAHSLVQEESGQSFPNQLESKSRFSNNSNTLETRADSENLICDEISREETGFLDEFDGLVTVGKFISVKGDFTLKSTEALIESPSLMAPFLLKEPDTFPPRQEELKYENRGYFNSSVGEFLMGLGLSFVNEWYYYDMYRMKTRLIKRSGKSDKLLDERKQAHENYLEAKKANEPFKSPFKSCTICSYASESDVVLEGHLLAPHSTARREYQCSFCQYLNRDPREMLAHMASVHSKIGYIKPPNSLHECPFCTFETNSKMKINSHLNKCFKYFDLGINQAPPRDFDYPCLTPKPITVAVVKAYEKSLNTMQRGRGRPKKLDNVPDSFQHHLDHYSSKKLVSPDTMPYNQFPNMPLAKNIGSSNQIYPYMVEPIPVSPLYGRANSLNDQSVNKRLMPFSNSSEQRIPQPNKPFTSHLFPVQKQKVKHQTPLSSSSTSSYSLNNMSKQPLSNTPQLSSLPQPPRLQGPYPVQANRKPSSSASVSNDLISRSLVVCEICDGYIKDLEQLKAHMQLIHKVKIHPKMLVSRPPLNCQKCQARFFTDQGLERHLLGSHGLVTSNMQELANKNKDAGCCTICGRVYASRLVSHMNLVHKTNLKPAHLSYKCTVCSATFNLYCLFENHVYLVHSGTKRSSTNRSASPSRKIPKVGNVSEGRSSERANGAQ